MKKISNYLKILFINFILIAYLLELSLFLFLPDAQKGLVKIKETLKSFDGIIVQDDCINNKFPERINTQNKF